MHDFVVSAKGLPSHVDTTDLLRMKPIVETTFKGVPYHTVTILVTMLRTHEDFCQLIARLQLDASDRQLLKFLMEHREQMKNVDDLL